MTLQFFSFDSWGRGDDVFDVLCALSYPQESHQKGINTIINNNNIMPFIAFRSTYYFFYWLYHYNILYSLVSSLSSANIYTVTV